MYLRRAPMSNERTVSAGNDRQLQLPVRASHSVPPPSPRTFNGFSEITRFFWSIADLLRRDSAQAHRGTILGAATRAFALLGIIAASGCNRDPHAAAPCVVYDGQGLDFDTAVKQSYGYAADLNSCANLAKAWVGNQPHDTNPASCVCKGTSSDEIVYTVKVFKSKIHAKCSYSDGIPFETEFCSCGDFYPRSKYPLPLFSNESTSCHTVPEYNNESQ